MSGEFLAGGVAVMGIALLMKFHDALRGMRLKRVMSSTRRHERY